jgi:spore germination cell wall hydrolase CwlJ-like protein
MLWQEFLPDRTQVLHQQRELTLLSMCIWGEARGNGNLAQQAVGFVVRNRVRSRREQFGSGWREVLLKPYQFSAFNQEGGSREEMFKPLEHDSEQIWRSCFGGALIAYESLYDDPSRTALFYYSGTRTPYWAQQMEETLRLKDFVFLTDGK